MNNGSQTPDFIGDNPGNLNFLHSLFSHTPVGFLLLKSIRDAEDESADFLFGRVNPAFESITGINGITLIGKSFGHLKRDSVPDPVGWLVTLRELVNRGTGSHAMKFSITLNQWYVLEDSPFDGFDVIISINAIPLELELNQHIFTGTSEQKTSVGKQAGNNRESDEMYRMIADNTSDGIILIGADTKIQYVSPAYLKQLGYSEQVELNRNAGTIYEIVHPDERDALFARIYEAIEAKKEELTYTYRVRHIKGHYFWREDKARFSYDKEGNYLRAYVVCRDITERVEAEQKIALLRKAFEQSPVGIMITDLAGNMEYINPKICEMTGYEMHELIGANITMFLPPEIDLNDRQDVWETIGRGEEWKGEFLNQKKNGEKYWEYDSVTPIQNSNGKIFKYLAIKEDVSDKKRMLEDLIKAKNLAESGDRLKTAFLHTISHEIRSPLHAILGFGELIAMQNLTEDERKLHLGTLNQSSTRLMNTINNYLDMAQLTSGTIAVRREPFEITGLCKEIHETLKAACAEKNLQSNLYLPEGYSGITIESDQELLKKAIRHLLDNALKFTREGRIDITLAKGSDHVTLQVSDTCIGISEEALNRIFNHFDTEEIDSNRHFDGSGLGLTIAKNIIHLLGGTLELNSNKGSGTQFSFSIPTQFIDIQPISEPPPPPLSSDSRPSILLAEDEEANVLYLEYIFSRLNVDLHLAPNGKRAVEICQEIPDISLILMDIRMPEMDGLEATKLIRQFRKELPIVALTAYSQTGDEHRILSAGCTDYLTKPISREKVLSIISKYVNL
jgi:PAS domain S-box-containing protein